MTTTVLALFKKRRDAETAIRALREAHFDSARLSVAEPGDARVPRYGAAAFKGVLAGTVGCAVLGVLIGVLVSGSIPGLPALLPGGWHVPVMLGLAGAGTAR